MTDFGLRIIRDYPRADFTLKLKSTTTLSEAREKVKQECKADDEFSRYQALGVVYGRDAAELTEGKRSLEELGLVHGSTIHFRAPADLKPNAKPVKKKGDAKDEGDDAGENRFKGLTESNVFKTFESAKDKRRKVCLEYIENNAKSLFAKPSVVSQLSSKGLVEILSSNHLNTPEVVLFDAVVAWGKAELKKQSKKDDNAELKKVLVDVLPLIRFPTMSTTDLATKVKPSDLVPSESILALFTHIANNASKPKKEEKKSDKGKGGKGGKETYDKIGGYISNPRVPKSGLFLEFAWDNTKLTSEIKYSDENLVAYKNNSDPDVSICIGNKGFRTGKHAWDIHVHKIGDEMWVGVTDDPNLVNSCKDGSIRNHSRLWGYKDGSRRDNAFHTAGGSQSKIPEPYRAGDIISCWLDCDNRTMKIYKNGKEQSICTTMPSGTEFYPIVVLDAGGDKVELLTNTGYTY